MTALVAGAVAVPELASTLVGSLALLALLLAVLGVVGVVSHIVRARRIELSIRMALGASPGRLRFDLLVEIMPVLATGLVLGALAGVSGGFAARALLHEVSPLDTPAIAGAALALLSAAALATWLPTRFVTRLDPARAMRSS
jgi:putative ABC transport system permease protein